MKQPQLGNQLSELRKKRGLTQQELSDSCNVDIRTIQRIESGEVEPRSSTLKMLAVALEHDPMTFIRNNELTHEGQTRLILIFSFLSGVIYFVNWLFYGGIIPAITGWNFNNLNIFFTIIYVFSGIVFFYGFYHLGSLQKNRVLRIASLIILIILPLFAISTLLETGSAYHFAGNMTKKLIVFVLGINGIVFGIGLLKNNGYSAALYKIAGALQIFISPMFLIPVPILHWVGLWLSIPLFVLFLWIIIKATKQYSNPVA